MQDKRMPVPAEVKTRLDDGAKRIFINTKGKNREEFSKEFLDFMEYINASTDEVAAQSESAKIQRIHNRVRWIKASEKMGVKLMQRWEELASAREEGEEAGWNRGHETGLRQGREDGHKVGRRDTLLELIRDGMITITEGAKRLGVSEEEIKCMLS